MIYFECNTDEILVKALGFTKTERCHAGSKGEVCNKLSNSKNSKGLVDEDPASPQPSYIQSLIEKNHEDMSLKKFFDSKRENVLVVLCPRLEGWVLRAAEQADVDPLNFGLPNDEKNLHKQGNTSLKQFEEFVQEIESRNNPMFNFLKSLLS